MVVVVDPGSASSHVSTPSRIHIYNIPKGRGMNFKFLSWLGILTGRLLESVGACNFACESK